MKRGLSFFLAAMLLALSCGCQRAQDRIFQEADKAGGNQAALEREGAYALQPPGPASGQTLSGELTVKMYYWRGDPPGIYWMAQEFMALHPGVSVGFDYQLDMYENYGLTDGERLARQESYYARLHAELASGEADYMLYNASQRLNPY